MDPVEHLLGIPLGTGKDLGKGLLDELQTRGLDRLGLAEGVEGCVCRAGVHTFSGGTPRGKTCRQRGKLSNVPHMLGSNFTLTTSNGMQFSARQARR